MPKLPRPNQPLADVNVKLKNDGSHEVVVCFMPDPVALVGEEQSRTFLALDGSASLRKMYGFGGPFGGDPNYVQAVARKLGATLCGAAKNGKCAGIYWAISPDGSKTKEIGEFDEAGWAAASVAGPKQTEWGRGTKLLPAIQYGVEKVATGAALTIGAILTDGIIEDEAACVAYCMKVGKEMADGKRQPVKLVLIGIGQEVDQGQLQRFDDMFEGTPLEGKVDVWSSGMVESMQDEADILGVLYGELMDENVIVADSGRVEDGDGAVLASFSDGLPGKLRFVLPKGKAKFVIHAGSHKVEQDVPADVLNVP